MSACASVVGVVYLCPRPPYHYHINEPTLIFVFLIIFLANFCAHNSLFSPLLISQGIIIKYIQEKSHNTMSYNVVHLCFVNCTFHYVFLAKHKVL
nr:hypothetical protein Itr_chr14CG10330 [Ipomoea trifida]GMC49520.1 hypothetical protein Iba_scaffold29910CG0040 [Ipomoea batatas]GMD83426.1 hypothetical protein Iba_chr14aCG4990 [Ipomoea batatas]GMD86906.1 hypothetical protein Iba_chr14bCG10610 [Ipomoea batatas]GME11535.1 hypothetical protein Iba_scaffold11838CG0080 [Ipomoea batatas]